MSSSFTLFSTFHNTNSRDSYVTANMLYTYSGKSVRRLQENLLHLSNNSDKDYTFLEDDVDEGLLPG